MPHDPSIRQTPRSTIATILPIVLSILVPCISAVLLSTAAFAAPSSDAIAPPPPPPPAQPPLIPVDPPLPTITLSRLNVQGSVDLQTRQVRHSINIYGQLEVPPDSNIIAMMHQLEFRQIIDENGNNILDQIPPAAAAARRRVSRFFSPLQPDRTSPMMISGDLPDLLHLPANIAAIRGHAYVMVARKQFTQDIEPIAPTPQIDLGPGFMIQITQVTREPAQLVVEFKFESEHPNPFFSASTAGPFIASANMINDQGASARNHGWSSSTNRLLRGVTQGTGKMMFPLPPERKARLLKLHVVTQAQELPIPFEITDVPLPFKQP
jgi:hypothetical protein